MYTSRQIQTAFKMAKWGGYLNKRRKYTEIFDRKIKKQPFYQIFIKLFHSTPPPHTQTKNPQGKTDFILGLVK